MSGYGTGEFDDTLAFGGVEGAISLINTDGAILVNVSGGVNLPDRQLVTVQPLGGDIYWGYNNTVTTATGTLVCDGQIMNIAAGDCADIYIITASLTPLDIRITEGG